MARTRPRSGSSRRPDPAPPTVAPSAPPAAVSGLIAVAQPSAAVYFLRPNTERVVTGEPGQAQVVVECVVVGQNLAAVDPTTLEVKAYHLDGDDLTFLTKAPPVQGTGVPYLFDVVIDLADADEAVIVLVLTAASARDGRPKVYATTCVTVRKG